MNARTAARSLAVLAVLLFAASAHAVYPPIGNTTPEPEPRRLIVKLDPSQPIVGSAAARGTGSATGISAVDAVSASLGVTHAQLLSPTTQTPGPDHPLANVLIVDLPASVSATSAAAQYASLRSVRYAHPDWMLTLCDTPSDPLYPLQWPLHNTGQNHPVILRQNGPGNDQRALDSGTPGADCDALAVHANPPKTTRPVIVAIIDTGIDRDHPDMAGRIWRNEREIPYNGFDDDHNGFVDDTVGWDFSGDTLAQQSFEDADPSDDVGHGSHVAGIAGAAIDDTIGMAGIVNDCLLMSLKFYPNLRYSTAARAVAYAADNGADVINMSWGGYFPGPILEEALTYASKKGVILCAASGNDGTDKPHYPAFYPNVIAVGATDSRDRVTDFSNYGNYIDVCAPGAAILSLRADSTDIYAETGEPNVHIYNEQYYIASGTSMSTPHVAGVAAYIRALAPGITPAEVRTLIRESADDLTDPYGTGESHPGYDRFSGAGRVNLARALQALPAWGVHLVRPVPNEIVFGTVELYATVVASEGEFVVEYGPGPFPRQWTELFRSQAPDANGLIGIWETGGVNGWYTLRIRNGADRVSTVTVFVANRAYAEITNPAELDTIPTQLTFTGSAYSYEFAGYVIEYGQGELPKDWIKIGEGSKPVESDILGEWYPDTLAEGQYSVRLIVQGLSGTLTGDTVSVYVRPPLAGNLGWKLPVTAPSWTHACNYGDFDRDGENEIVVGTATGLKFFDLHGNAETVAGLSDLSAHAIRVPPVVGDLDGDGDANDLAFLTEDGMLFLNPSIETPLVINTPTLPRSTGGWDPYLRPYICLKDIDGDRRDEIHYYAGGLGGKPERAIFIIYDSRGRVLFADSVGGAFLTADLDGSGRDALFAARDRLYRLPFNGYTAASLPLPPTGGIPLLTEHMLATDLDADGFRDLVLVAGSDDVESHVMLAVDKTHSVKESWPRSTGIASFAVPSAPAFFDLDGDGRLEYGMAWQTLTFGMLSIWKSDGTPFAGDSSAIFTRTRDPGNMVTMRVADIDSDNALDLLTYSVPDVFYWNPRERLFAWDQAARVKDGWPFVIETGEEVVIADQQPIVGDINHDGRTDVTTMTSAGSLVFYDIPRSAFNADMAPFAQWRMNQRHNNNTPDNDPFFVRGLRPTRFERDLTDTASITITLSHPVDPTTVTDATFRVTGNVGGDYPGLTTVSEDGLTLSFKPDQSYVVGDHVTLTLSDELGAASGAHLRHPFISEFDLPPERLGVIALSPASGSEPVQSGMPVLLTFAESLSPNSLANLTVTMVGSISGPMALDISLRDNLRTLVATPVNPGIEAQTVTVAVKGPVLALSGSRWTVDESWSYNTRAFVPVAATVPRTNTTAADPATAIVIDLTDAADPATINGTNVHVEADALGRISGDILYDAENHRVTFTPDHPLPPGARITVSISGILNKTGAHWPQGHVWGFRTPTAATLGQFGTMTNYAEPGLSYFVRTGDFDGDGYTDMMAGGGDGNSLYFYHNSRTGELNPDTTYEVAIPPRNTCVADLNGDGRQDIVLSEFNSNMMPILYGTGAGRFRVDTLEETPRGLGELLAADFDSDGDCDLLAVDLLKTNICYMENESGELFRSGRIDPAARPLALAPIDVDRDGDLDLAVVGLRDARIVVEILINRGDFHFVTKLTYPLVSGRSVRASIVSGDLNGDGYADIVAAAAAQDGTDQPNVLATLFGDSLGFFHDLKVTAPQFKPDQLFLADLDGDDDLDVALPTPTIGGFGVFLNDGSGGLVLDARYGGNRSFTTVAPIDLDNDGDLDLTMAGYFGGAFLFSNDALCACPAMGEVTEDGIVDVSDATTLIDYLFRFGSEPETDRFCPAINRADVNCDDHDDVADLVILMDYLFRDGPPPCNPCMSGAP